MTSLENQTRCTQEGKVVRKKNSNKENDLM